MPQRVVREANKRTALEAEGLVFSHEKGLGLPKVLALKEHGSYIPVWIPKPL